MYFLLKLWDHKIFFKSFITLQLNLDLASILYWLDKTATSLGHIKETPDPKTAYL